MSDTGRDVTMTGSPRFHTLVTKTSAQKLLRLSFMVYYFLIFHSVYLRLSARLSIFITFYWVLSIAMWRLSICPDRLPRVNSLISEVYGKYTCFIKTGSSLFYIHRQRKFVAFALLYSFNIPLNVFAKVK